MKAAGTLFNCSLSFFQPQVNQQINNVPGRAPHNRTGHLFQNRYKSIVCEEETYLLELVRYIHLNPLRAGLVKDLPELDQYPWSGHGVLMGNQLLEGQELAEILLRFGKNVNQARSAYRAFIANGIKAGQRTDLVGSGLRRSMALKGIAEKEWGNFDARILGSGDFVDSLQQNETLRDRLPLAMTLAELIRRVAAVFDLPTEAVSRHGKARPISEARGIVAYFAVRELGLKGIDVAKAIHLTSAGVSIAVQRGERLVREKPKLNEILAKLVI